MTDKKRVKSVDKAISLIRLIAESEHGIGVTEAAKAIGTVNSAAHTLLRTLLDQGVVEQHQDRYFLGREFFRIANIYSMTGFRRQLGEGLLNFQRDYPEGVGVFTELVQYGIITVLRVSPERIGMIQRSMSEHLSLVHNTTGQVFMAYLDQEYRKNIYEHLEIGEETRKHYSENCDLIRKQGYAVKVVNDTSLVIVAPMWRESEQLAGVLSLRIPLNHDEYDRQVQVLLAIIKKIRQI